VKLLLSPKPDLNSPDYGYGFQIDRELKDRRPQRRLSGNQLKPGYVPRQRLTAVVMSNYGSGSRPVSSKMQELIAATTATRSDAAAKVRGQ
jgi:hypothetical protein